MTGAVSDPSKQSILWNVVKKYGPESVFARLTPQQRDAAQYLWPLMSRVAQRAPVGDWSTWVFLAGRGSGKSRAGAEWIREGVLAGECSRIALLGPTAADVRDVMIEGDSGLLSVFPPHQRPQYEPSKRRVTFHNGAIATAYSADAPERLRGPQHDRAWVDELGAFTKPDAWEMLLFGLRLGTHPRALITTTPRPSDLVRGLLKDPKVVITRGSTSDNAANLAPKFLEDIKRRYEGTRLGRQELEGELLDDVEGALWSYALIDRQRLAAVPCEMTHLVVAVDPALTSKKSSNETGIVIAGAAGGRYYVLGDDSANDTPDGWARRVLNAYREFGADEVVVEGNAGRDLLISLLRGVERAEGGEAKVPIRLVNATRGKRTRAEPVAMLYEQGLVSHVGSMKELDDQLCSWVPGNDSPDRMDALVWAISALVERVEASNSGTATAEVLTGTRPRRELAAPADDEDVDEDALDEDEMDARPWR